MKANIVVFDFDGVLFDTLDVVAQHTLAHYPSLSLEKQKEMLCGNFREELEERADEKVAVRLTKDEIEERKLAYELEKASCKPYEGVDAMLRTLYEKGYTLTINTAAKKRNSEPVLVGAGLETLISILASAELGKRKEEKFELIANEYGVTLEELLFVTDTVGDIKEALARGVPTVAVTWGAHDRSFFEREHHPNLVAVVDSPQELAEYIENYFQYIQTIA